MLSKNRLSKIKDRMLEITFVEFRKAKENGDSDESERLTRELKQLICEENDIKAQSGELQLVCNKCIDVFYNT